MTGPYYVEPCAQLATQVETICCSYYFTLSWILFLIQVFWTKNGASVVYPCHAVIISMEISTGHQRFFMGHTDKVRRTITVSAIYDPYILDFYKIGTFSFFRMGIEPAASGYLDQRFVDNIVHAGQLNIVNAGQLNVVQAC